MPAIPATLEAETRMASLRPKLGNLTRPSFRMEWSRVKWSGIQYNTRPRNVAQCSLGSFPRTKKEVEREGRRGKEGRREGGRGRGRTEKYLKVLKTLS